MKFNYYELYYKGELAVETYSFADAIECCKLIGVDKIVDMNGNEWTNLEELIQIKNLLEK